MSDALRAGAAALQTLLRRIGQQGDADLETSGETEISNGGGDARDYRAMGAMAFQDLEANLHHQSPAHREGYLRALTHLLSLTADGAGPGDGWDPIARTEVAFWAPRAAGELLARIAAARVQAAE